MNIELYLNEAERLCKQGYSVKKAIEIVEGWMIEDEYRKQSKSKTV